MQSQGQKEFTSNPNTDPNPESQPDSPKFYSYVMLMDVESEFSKTIESMT